MATKAYYFELYLLHDEMSAESWSQFCQAVRQRIGFLGWFELTFRCDNNVVRLFVTASRDLSALSNGIERVVLVPVEADELRSPRAVKREAFVQVAAGASLLDLRERYTIQHRKGLDYAVLRLRSVGPVRLSLFFSRDGGQWSLALKHYKTFPVALLAMNFQTNTRYLKRVAPKYLDIEKSLSALTRDPDGAVFAADTFPYFTEPHYIGLANYEFDKHSFIIGSSGSGKSKLIELLIDRLHASPAAPGYRVVVIDPHASLEHDLRALPSSKVINFSGETAQLFPRGATDVSAATELTTTLLKSLMSETPSPRLERVLRFSLYVLFVGQCMSLPMLKNFLTDLDVRDQLLKHVRGFVPDNLILFFGSEYNELRTQHYAESISPIIALVEEMQLQPTLLGEADVSLAKTVQDNFLTVFSLNKVSMGEKVVKTVAGLLIQQIFLLAQARAFEQKVILVVDEVSVVQNPALASILAEARKFNLTVILSQQYFGQIEKDLRDAILSNVVNYYVFRVSDEDARALEANLTIELPKSVVQAAAERGLKESDVRTKLMTELHPRQCLVRIAASGRILPAVRARTMDTTLHAVDTAEASRKPAPKLPEQFVLTSADTPTPSVPASPVIGPAAEPVSSVPPQSIPVSSTAKRPNIMDLLAQQSSGHHPIDKDQP
ncbi:MAG TPA: type IV secretion system DNA-binding domain-containing protein [Candidatus Saccharimonadales bacterium]|nr:type IV secretion system DNA-binding domain-containing protein [Candidatus Saccharimonadales bacterium]